ncbi:hydrolase 1, exosortase A system-associated [Sphingosinicella sp. CPCC 101087]|uniref:hydrolase 1, exosortase A system-associated n=1 Tax=Sphingosinicella sp. CPCC 101087 TaxID=2497754 RepID=UPI0013ED1401|nr:hydrolase 1, exosortase A system-associated [Sphingosinicella sp. CPCC 101087]
MRRLLTFACEGETLGAALDEGGGDRGLLMVTGGSQTRIGSHRMYERLAMYLAERGISCLRFDRRGVGDSSGDDPGYRSSGPDLTAAADLLRRERPGLTRIDGFGLCDGATAIALLGDQAGLDGLILVNPWLVETASGEPAPAAIRQHYRDRLLSLDGWKRLVSGGVNYRKLFKGILKSGSRAPSTLAQEVAAAMARHRLPAELLLATGDATAIAADVEMRSPIFRGLAGKAQKLDTDSHTFARPGDEGRLSEAVLEAVRRLDARPAVKLPEGS